MPDCSKCKKFVVKDGENVYNICKSDNKRSDIMDERKTQEIDNVGPIPRYYYEAETARLERTIKRLFWALVMTILLLVGTNACWIWFESQFEDTVVTQEVDSGEGSAYVAGIGDVYGESTANSQKANP